MATDPADATLLQALRDTPRHHRMPPLPADTAAAQAAGTETALAFTLEAARRAAEHRGPIAPEVSDVSALFLRSLADLIRAALSPEGGDPTFQAQLLHAHDPRVAEHVHLGAQATADRRALRAAVDAVAHPGKLQAHPPGPQREALAGLHGLAHAGDWPALAAAASHWLSQDASSQDWLQALLAHPALARLRRGDELLRHEAVQRYQALCAGRGPLAGSAAASASGRASARAGAQAEGITLQSFRQIAQRLNQRAAPGTHGTRYRAIGSLRTPRGFPGEAHRSKDEWDAAILCESADGGPADLVLLAEVKASPAAATPDFARLLRGLQRLALAEAGTGYRFPSADGLVTLGGDALRALSPQGHALPARVIYCCAAPPEVQPPMLSAASRAVLLSEPASLAFAARIARGESPTDIELMPVWQALPTEARLRSALHQYSTARDVREAMLDPRELLLALERTSA